MPQACCSSVCQNNFCQQNTCTRISKFPSKPFQTIIQAYLDQIFFRKLYTIQCLKNLKNTCMKKHHSALETKLLNAIWLSTAISNWNWIFKSTTQTLQLLALSRVSCSVHCLYVAVTFYKLQQIIKHDSKVIRSLLDAYKILQEV